MLPARWLEGGASASAATQYLVGGHWRPRSGGADRRSSTGYGDDGEGEGRDVEGREEDVAVVQDVAVYRGGDRGDEVGVPRAVPAAGFAVVGVAPASPAAPVSTELSNWIPVVDRRTGKPYYYNKKTTRPAGGTIQTTTTKPTTTTTRKQQ